MERPPRRDNPIALTGHIADLENQLYPGRRQPRGAGIRNYPPDGSDAYAAPPQRNIRIRLAAPIYRKTEAEDPRAEVHGDVKVVRKDLKPQCHLHHWRMAYRNGQAARRWPESCYKTHPDLPHQV